MIQYFKTDFKNFSDLLNIFHYSVDAREFILSCFDCREGVPRLFYFPALTLACYHSFFISNPGNTPLFSIFKTKGIIFLFATLPSIEPNFNQLDIICLQKLSNFFQIKIPDENIPISEFIQSFDVISQFWFNVHDFDPWMADVVVKVLSRFAIEANRAISISTSRSNLFIDKFRDFIRQHDQVIRGFVFLISTEVICSPCTLR